MANEWTGERLESFVFHDSTIEHLHRYALAKEFAQGKWVLDIACGEGYGSQILAETAEMVNGVDIDDSIIAKARSKYKRKNIVFTTGSVEKIPFDPGSFDMVVSFETLEHTTAHEAMLEEIKRVLKPGGILLISTPDKMNYSDKPGYANPFHKKELYEVEFKTLLKKYFRYQEFYYQNLITASVISNNGAGPVNFYDGDFTGVQKINHPEPLYMVAVCSDEEVILPPTSLFIANNTLETAITIKEKEIKNTWSYKLGNGLLFPAKLLRRLFRKSANKY
jgi:2-polyprenyl-3-methyl-5-hydroxy-6-metoxy-1,4-benzoquinol methylase